ncbi:hypothetical protein NPIL_668751 [Nephila pilipes]|uniref:Uncharacterized protein n=1 Tax=Nephila pilipes TaxID=299642 RepID=A0A8X6NT86_NEPPI|nr:hypothetical protein NPIL_668751 [Nephila pilipes]
MGDLVQILWFNQSDISALDYQSEVSTSLHQIEIGSMPAMQTSGSIHCVETIRRQLSMPSNVPPPSTHRLSSDFSFEGLLAQKEWE